MDPNNPYVFRQVYDPEVNQLILYNATAEDLIDYVYPPGLETLAIINGYMTHFDIPEGVETAQLLRMGLRTLTVPDSIKRLEIDKNYIQCLDLPAEIEFLEAPKNRLQELHFRGGGHPVALCEANLKDNCFVRLEFEPPESLYHLDVSKNDYLRYVSPALVKIYTNSVDMGDIAALEGRRSPITPSREESDIDL
jgi:hypothetical protein